MRDGRAAHRVNPAGRVDLRAHADRGQSSLVRVYIEARLSHPADSQEAGAVSVLEVATTSAGATRTRAGTSSLGQRTNNL